MECRTLYNPKSLNNLYGGRPVLMHKLLLPLESLLAASESALYVSGLHGMGNRSVCSGHVSRRGEKHSVRWFLLGNDSITGGPVPKQRNTKTKRI